MNSRRRRPATRSRAPRALTGARQSGGHYQSSCARRIPDRCSRATLPTGRTGKGSEFSAENSPFQPLRRCCRTQRSGARSRFVVQKLRRSRQIRTPTDAGRLDTINAAPYDRQLTEPAESQEGRRGGTTMVTAQQRATGTPSTGVRDQGSPEIGQMPVRHPRTGAHLQNTGGGRPVAGQLCEGSSK